MDGVSHRIDRDDGGIVHAPAPAVVVSIAVKPGDTVVAGDRLAVLEAMKMEMQVVAPFSGKVRQVMTIPNVQVDTGAPLLQIDPVRTTMPGAATERVVFGVSRPPAGTCRGSPSACGQSLEELRQLMLGFDVDPRRPPRLLTEWNQSCPVEGDEIREAEDEILNIFVDICSLFQRRTGGNHRASGEEPSAEAYLFSYLRMLETAGEGLPSEFVGCSSARLGPLWRATWTIARVGRKPALDLQIAPTGGAADRAGPGSTGTALAASGSPGAAR